MEKGAGRPAENSGVGRIAGPWSAAGLGVAGPVLFLTGIATFAAGFSSAAMFLCALLCAFVISKVYWRATLPFAAAWALLAIFGFCYASFRAQYSKTQIRLPASGDSASFICVSSPYPSSGGVKCLAEFEQPYAGQAFVLLRPRWLVAEGVQIKGQVQKVSSKIMEIAVVSVSAESNYLQKARNRLAASVRSAVAEPQASLLLGSVFGRGLGFDRDFKEKMIRSGTIHLVAVSGFNIVVLAAVLQGAGYFISRRVVRALLINGIVWLFVIFSGAPLSALRAALMFTCGEISYLAGRGVRPATGIISAAALICIWDPSAIADAGFLLSFASILGLAIFSKPIEVLLGRVINKDFTTSIAPSLAAQLGVLPASIFIFGSVSAATIPANILASFIVEILFAAAVAASFFALIGLPIVAWLIGYPAASVMVRLIEIFSNFPQFGVVGRLPLVVFMILWLGIVGYLISKKHEEAY